MTLPADRLLVPSSGSVRQAVEIINAELARIALVIDERSRLVGTVTDGDVRRGLLRGEGLDAGVLAIAARDPLTVTAETTAEEAAAIMRQRSVRQLPVVDADGHVRAIHVLDVAPGERSSEPVLIMAGGLGIRLGDVTAHMPKPLVEVRGRPILQTLIEDLAAQGFTNILLALGYKGQLIEEHFGDGAGFGVRIRYIREPVALGTAGAIGLARDSLADDFLVMNADLLTKVNFKALLDFHRAQDHDLTVAVTEWTSQLRFGLVEAVGSRVVALREKPVLRHFVNAGIYVLRPKLLDRIPADVRFDMDELINAALARGDFVGCFPIHEYWADIGEPGDLRRAGETYPGDSER